VTDAGAPVSAVPVSAVPVSAAPVSAAPVSAARAARPSGRQPSLGRAVAEIPVLLGIAVAIVVVVRLVVVQAFYIPSGSMLPQLQLQDKVLVSRLSYRLHGVHRGDIVVFDAPPEVPAEHATGRGGGALTRAWRYVAQRLGLAARGDVFIKRVIGLPGETVEAHDGHVFIDGRLLLEPYLPPGTQTSSFGPIAVPRGRLWVMGDFRSNSEDSRVFGPIRRSTVIGRAVLRVWPVSHAAFL